MYTILFIIFAFILFYNFGKDLQAMIEGKNSYRYLIDILAIVVFGVMEKLS